MAQVRVMEGLQQTTESPLSDLLARPPVWTTEMWHAMNARDDMQIESEVLHGTSDESFIYAMMVQGSLVAGISVVGAKQLATEYGGMRARLVASTEKRGKQFVFRQFSPLTIDSRVILELEDQDDYYEAILEVTDIKTGNSIEIRKSETASGTTKDGRKYARPHFATIAESKAFRNGVLALIPQSVQKQFKLKCLKRAMDVGYFDADDKKALKAAVAAFLRSQNQSPVSAELTLDQLRDGCLSYATTLGLTVNRQVLASLTYAELQTLSKASKTDGQFAPAAQALGLISPPTEQATPAPKRGRPQGSTNKPKDEIVHLEPKGDPPIKELMSSQASEIHGWARQDIPSSDNGHHLSFAEVADAISTAKTTDDLQMAMDLIRYVEDPTNQPELMTMYRDREAELGA